MKRVGLVAGKGNLPVIAAEIIKHKNLLYTVLLENLAENKIKLHKKSTKYINIIVIYIIFGDIYEKNRSNN